MSTPAQAAAPVAARPQIREAWVDEVKEWLRLNAEIAQLKAQLKPRVKRKAELTSRLLEVMKSKKIEKYKLNEGASLVPKRRKSKQTITKKFLEAQLKQFFAERSAAPEVADSAVQFVLEHRAEVVKEELLHKVQTDK